MHQQQAIEDLHQQYSTHQNELRQKQTLQQQQHDALAMQVHDQTHELEQMTNDMMEQRKQLQREVERLRTTVMEQFKAAQHEREQKLSELDGDHRRQREQLREDLTTLFQQHFER